MLTCSHRTTTILCPVQKDIGLITFYKLSMKDDSYLGHYTMKMTPTENWSWQLGMTQCSSFVRRLSVDDSYQIWIYQNFWEYAHMNGTGKTRVDNYSRKIKGTPLQTASLECIRKNLGILHKKLIQHPFNLHFFNAQNYWLLLNFQSMKVHWYLTSPTKEKSWYNNTYK